MYLCNSFPAFARFIAHVTAAGTANSLVLTGRVQSGQKQKKEDLKPCICMTHVVNAISEWKTGQKKTGLKKKNESKRKSHHQKMKLSAVSCSCCHNRIWNALCPLWPAAVDVSLQQRTLPAWA